ncbi:MAG: DUF1905 domain-containing protein [Saprospiraceae bacterium]|nr:DUF1905 domain-containing protein [Saprospiraceae bacterium]MBK8108953.1 DUF1905 domain-containing protein [Saprospiraceae bacterium]
MNQVISLILPPSFLMQAIFKNKVLLEKFPGKGGWTYAALDTLYEKSSRHFGMLRVKGTIDHFAFEQFNLMPMGDGRLFLPVKKAIRQAIRKEAGDWVEVELFLDTSDVELPMLILDCLKEDYEALVHFQQLSPSIQKRQIEHIMAAKKDETIAKRITDLMSKLKLNKKLI